ncbi:MAG TPA: response regulator transcription factor [Steroidobacteraceae bacterium]|jgi:DNA-binding NarL/FixJ family response regulator|nr:response regulator transcription factor [Steroidobacteraceae bacterium]
MKPARIIIADDHELVRRGLTATLADVPGWSIVAQAANGRHAAELVVTHKPDVAILDLSMPELNGLDATRLILAAAPHTRVLILTAHESEQLIREVLSAGAQGYVLKSDAGRVLVSAVTSLLEGRTFFTSRVAQLVLEGYLRSASEAPAAMPTLSAREREIVQLLAEGRSNKEVAQLLKISVKTAETHRSNIMRKMAFDSLADLIRYAVRNKIIDV